MIRKAHFWPLPKISATFFKRWRIERLPPDKTTAGGPPNIHLHSRGQSPTFVRSLHLVYAIESRLIPNQGHILIEVSHGCNTVHEDV